MTAKRGNRVQKYGELDLIARIQERTAAKNRSVRLGIGDDCAILQIPAETEMVITTDFSLEGRHFRRDWHTPESVGHRCLARGLSDIAAMGARPIAAFLSLAMPAPLDVRWMDRFMTGFGELAQRWGTELAGGDTSEAPGAEILADVVVTGVVKRGQALRRSDAKVGDGLYVTGSLGGSAVELSGLAASRTRSRRWMGVSEAQAHTFPDPRIGVGRALVRRRLATACMDLSDGLSSDVRRLCESSSVGVEIDVARLPLATGATIEQALHGGEDYELLFTARADARVPRKLAGVAVSCVGRVRPSSFGVKLLAEDGSARELRAGGWEHFRKRERS